MIVIRKSVCPLCEAMCGLEVTVDGDRITAVRGDRDDPLSAGFICPKAVALRDLTADLTRLREPMLRTHRGFETVSWDAAMNLAGEQLGKLQRRHGRDAVAFYSGNPNLHSYSAQLVELAFKRSLGTRNAFSTASVDHLPHMFAAKEMFGHALLLTVPDIDRTELLLVLGANPAESNGSLMGAPGIPLRFRRLRERGGRIVVVDPRRTRTADLADQHIFIRPGTDALLLLALLQTLFTEGLVRPGRLQTALAGVEELRAACMPFPPERVAACTGIDASTIVALARQFSASRAAVCYGRIGVSTQAFGSHCAWLMSALNVLTGNLDRAGGAMFPRPAVDLVGIASLLGAAGGPGRWSSRVRGLPEFGGELPLAVLAEEIETPGSRQVRALITSAGNPVLSAPNGARLGNALQGLEFMVSIDRYINETTRHAHLILPAAMPLERDHYDVVFRAFGVRDTARFQEAVLPRPEGVREDWQIYSRLGAAVARARGGRGWRLGSLGLAVIEAVTPRRALDLMLRLGPHKLSLARLGAEPHALDLGPLRSGLPQRLRTRGKRINLAPPPLMSTVGELTRLLDTLAPSDGALVLTGRRQLRSNNSWMHHLPRLQRKDNRCSLMISSRDALRRGLVDGQTVEVRSRTGAVRAPLEVTDSMMPGVVSLPHGFGHVHRGAEAPIAASWRGASVNDLTDETRLDLLSGTAAFSGVPVDVWAVSDDSADREPQTASAQPITEEH